MTMAMTRTIRIAKSRSLSPSRCEMGGAVVVLVEVVTLVVVVG